MVLDIFRTLTYGQKLQIAEGSIAVPLERGDIETWVTKSEERNEKAGKQRIKPKAVENIKPEGGSDMTKEAPTGTTNPNDDCHQEKGYFCFNPQPIPKCATFFEFTSCCCEDGTAGLLEALYQFALVKKAANPAILKVAKRYSPNTACSALLLEFHLLGNVTGTLADQQAILQYYQTLLYS